MLAGFEFKGKVQSGVADAEADDAINTDSTMPILQSMFQTMLEDEDTWDRVGGGQEEILVAPDWHREFLGRVPQQALEQDFLEEADRLVKQGSDVSSEGGAWQSVSTPTSSPETPRIAAMARHRCDPVTTIVAIPSLCESTILGSPGMF